MHACMMVDEYTEDFISRICAMNRLSFEGTNLAPMGSIPLGGRPSERPHVHFCVHELPISIRNPTNNSFFDPC
jgi:hypothetical protein